MFEKILPIGSVVLLQDGVKKLMITGMQVATEEEPDKFYDYIGVLYPEGFIGDQGNFLFNHDDINDVIFTGYNNPEREKFLEVLEKYKNGKADEGEESSQNTEDDITV